ncbi:MAG TPA: pyrimidine dimer DNA glycosylase/endonuclease V [Fimbriiglobus sp.]|jgi:hypothetical protein
MRLWTLHPRYLDARGLVAVWREALLAQSVLRGATKGYLHHPQLVRFRASTDPQAAIAAYLAGIRAEAITRGYAFDVTRIARKPGRGRIAATTGQLQYEWRHLKRKLRTRDPVKYKSCLRTTGPVPHPLFRIQAGPVEEWEKTK